jgi:hypothetical protein
MQAFHASNIVLAIQELGVASKGADVWFHVSNSSCWSLWSVATPAPLGQ